MDLYRIIGELTQERERIQRIIDSLEEMEPSGKVAAPGVTRKAKPAGKRRGRKSMDHAARADVSARMKRYWEQRRAEKNVADNGLGKTVMAEKRDAAGAAD